LENTCLLDQYLIKLNWEHLRINKIPPNRNIRRSGGLPISTHQTGRPMTLRPRLTTGLPFRWINDEFWLAQSYNITNQ